MAMVKLPLGMISHVDPNQKASVSAGDDPQLKTEKPKTMAQAQGLAKHGKGNHPLVDEQMSDLSINTDSQQSCCVKPEDCKLLKHV